MNLEVSTEQIGLLGVDAALVAAYLVNVYRKEPIYLPVQLLLEDLQLTAFQQREALKKLEEKGFITISFGQGRKRYIQVQESLLKIFKRHTTISKTAKEFNLLDARLRVLQLTVQEYEKRIKKLKTLKEETEVELLRIERIIDIDTLELRDISIMNKFKRIQQVYKALKENYKLYKKACYILAKDKINKDKLTKADVEELVDISPKQKAEIKVNKLLIDSYLQDTFNVFIDGVIEDEYKEIIRNQEIVKLAKFIKRELSSVKKQSKRVKDIYLKT